MLAGIFRFQKDLTLGYTKLYQWLSSLKGLVETQVTGPHSQIQSILESEDSHF